MRKNDGNLIIPPLLYLIGMRAFPVFIGYVVVFLISVIMVLAAKPSGSSVPSIEDLSPDDLSPFIQKASLEMQGQELPGPFRSLFGDERINIHVAAEDGEAMVIGFVTEEGKIKNIVTAEVKDPSLNIYTTKATVVKVLVADEPVQALREALKADEITYKGVGFKNKLKYTFVSLFARAAGIFMEEPSAERVVKEQAGLASDGISSDESKETIASKDSEGQEEASAEDESAEDESAEDESDLTEGSAADDANDGEEEESESSTLSGTKHVVKLIEGGFSEKELTIKAGDTIVWKNERTGRVKKGLVFGNQKCRDVKSSFIMAGEEFSWTFEKPMFCLISDGIYTTQSLKVTVE